MHKALGSALFSRKKTKRGMKCEIICNCCGLKLVSSAAEIQVFAIFILWSHLREETFSMNLLTLNTHAASSHRALYTMFDITKAAHLV